MANSGATISLILNVRFLRPEEGGRSTDVVIRNNIYGCLLVADGEYFDARLQNRVAHFVLGEQYTAAFKVLTTSAHDDRFQVGKEIQLWEGKVIACGRILSIQKPPSTASTAPTN